jgi:hypothetical protein
MKPSFSQIYGCLVQNGPAKVISSRGTEYTVEAGKVQRGDRIGEKIIKAYPKSGCVYIHADCWGDNITCQKTRAGGIYNGRYSIYDWYKDNR